MNGPLPEATPGAIAWIERLAERRLVNRFYEWGFHKVTLAVADSLAWIDRYVVDGLINILGYETLEAGRRMRAVQTGLVPDYVLAVVIGVIGVAAWGFAR